MRLIVAIPERWEDESCPVTWALLRADGSLVREGDGLVGELPTAQHVTAVIAASRVLLCVASLPRRGARRVRGALAYAVEDQLTTDPESVHAVAAGALRNGSQSIAVVDRAWLRSLVCALESVRASPQSLTVETCLPPTARGEWVLVLRKSGGFLRTGEAAGMSLDRTSGGSVPSVLQLALDAARTAGAIPKRIVLHADSAPDVQAWERELGVPCELAPSWRIWQSTEPPAIEFLQGEFAVRRGAHALWLRLRPAAVLVAAAIAVEIAGVFAHWGALRYEKAQLEARMNEQFRTAFPQAQAIVDPALQMRRNLIAARAAAGAAQESDFLPLLAQASRPSAGAAWRVKTVRYDGGRLTLDVLLADRGGADSVLKRFDQRNLGVSLEAASPRAAGGEARLVFVPRGAR
jgi:general secretion pathway protein L